MIQTILVIITFSLAIGYLLKIFVWNPIFENKQKSTGTLDGGKTKCGNNNCGCQ